MDVCGGFLGTMCLFAAPVCIGLRVVSSLSFAASGQWGLGVGLVAALWVEMLSRKWYVAMLADLYFGHAEVLELHVLDAFYAAPSGSWFVLVLCCGDDRTVVCCGTWWKDPKEDRSIEWRGLQANFPSAKLLLTRLPRSGKVLMVEVAGESLRIKHPTNAAVLPELAIPTSSLFETIVVNSAGSDLKKNAVPHRILTNHVER